MKFRWRAWIKSSGLSVKVARRISQGRINDNLRWVVCGGDFNNGIGYTVDLTRRTIKLWEEI